VASFIDFLRNRPKARERTIQWAIQQNKALGGLSSDPKSHFVQEKMELRYGQIWRDAYLKKIYVILRKLDELSKDVAAELCIESSSVVLEPDLDVSHSDITEAWQFIEVKLKESLFASVVEGSEADGDVAQGLAALQGLIREFTEACEMYFKWPRNALTVGVNRKYCTALLTVLNKYQDTIFQGLGHHTKWTNPFADIVNRINNLYGNMQLQLHLKSEDKDLTSQGAQDYTSIVNLSHKEEKVVKTFIDALFAWANKVPKDILIDIIDEVMEKDYQSYVEINLTKLNPFNFFAEEARPASSYKIYNPLTYRYRAVGVGEYLKEAKSSQTVDGSSILAYVLSTGGSTTTSLNTCIITRLMPVVVQGTLGEGGIVDVNLMSLDNALSRNSIEFSYYAEKVMAFVRTAPQFTQTFSDVSQLHLNKALYRWVDGLPRRHFNALVQKALDGYDPVPESYWGIAVAWAASWVREPRTLTVQSYLGRSELKNSQILGLIFREGGVEKGTKLKKRSLNMWVFEAIFKQIVSTISASKADDPRRTDEDYRVVIKVTLDEALEYPAFPSFMRFARQYSESAPGDSVKPAEIAHGAAIAP
jgi:hypothetical protein